jgi:hypothetical protein
MAATPEKKVKDKCVAQLKAMGAVYFYPVTGGLRLQWGERHRGVLRGTVHSD